MPVVFTSCSKCDKEFARDSDWVEENKRLGYKIYCSLECMRGCKDVETKTLTCERVDCNNIFLRSSKEISPHNYCSRSCSAIVNNTKFPKHKRAVLKYCLLCGKACHAGKMFCSPACKNKNQTTSKYELVDQIKTFYRKHKRLPLKAEFRNYSSVRRAFGTWNKAIVVAGFKPNPVMFANKHIALDGHKCDSLAERIIDDWLFRRKIAHQRGVPYPGRLGLKTDFLVGDYWVEFFGLSGELRRYDQLKKKKLALIKRRGLKLIEIYPKHLFPKGKLEEVLGKYL